MVPVCDWIAFKYLRHALLARLKNDVTSHSDRSKEYESKCAELEKALERSNSSKSDSDLKQSQIAKELERYALRAVRTEFLRNRDGRILKHSKCRTRRNA